MPCRGRISGPSSPIKCTQTDPGTKKMEIVCCSGLQASLKKMAVIGLWLQWLVVTSLWRLLPLVVYGPDPPCRRILRPIFRLKEHPEIRNFEILTAVTAAVTAFRNMKPCNLANRQRYSVGTRQRYSVGTRQRYSVGTRQRYSVGTRQRYSVGTRHLIAGWKRHTKDKCRNLIVRHTNFHFIITIKDN